MRSYGQATQNSLSRCLLPHHLQGQFWNQQRDAMMQLYTCIFFRVIIQHFIIGESAVSQATRRIRLQIEGDKKLKKQIKRVEKELNLSKV